MKYTEEVLMRTIHIFSHVSHLQKLNVMLVLGLIILSATAIGSVRPNQARAISVGGILDIAKTAFGMLASVAAAPDQIKSFAEGLGIAPKDTSSQPQASQLDTSKQLQDVKERLNTISAQLNTLNEEDRKDAESQLAQAYNETLSNQPAPVRYSMQQNLQQVAPPDLQYLHRVQEAWKVFNEINQQQGLNPEESHPRLPERQPVIQNMRV
jgi:hypothetical protein